MPETLVNPIYEVVSSYICGSTKFFLSDLISHEKIRLMLPDAAPYYMTCVGLD